jgi:hypothetical protein
MSARVSTFEGDPEQVDELTRLAGERVLPALKELDGFHTPLGGHMVRTTYLCCGGYLIIWLVIYPTSENSASSTRKVGK